MSIRDELAAVIVNAHPRPTHANPFVALLAAEAILAGFEVTPKEPVEPCGYTVSHTRHWCGNPTCRDS